MTRILAAVVGKKEKTGPRQTGNLGNRRPRMSDDGQRHPWIKTNVLVAKKKAQLCQTEVTYLGYTLQDGKVVAKESQKKDCNSDPHPNYTKASKRILGYRWLLQTLDTWVGNLSYPVVPPNQGRRGVCVDPRSPESL